MESIVYSVSQLSLLIKKLFDNTFRNISVYGEILQISKSKYTYIDLGDKDQNQSSGPIIKCALSSFYKNNELISQLSKGDIIQVSGNLSYYDHGSSLTLWASNIEILQSKIGKNLLKKKLLIDKLNNMGLLDKSRKKQLPKYCKSVAILTAKDGAVYGDILTSLKKRFPVDTILYPINVQGDNAPTTIVNQLKNADSSDCDVIILGRGGGSNVDLSCFDDENVALTISQLKKPIITCIGHNTDQSVADLISDVYAITPTEAGTFINPSLDDINSTINQLNDSLQSLMIEKLERYQLNNKYLLDNLLAYSPSVRLLNEKKLLTALKQNLNSSFSSFFTQYKCNLENYKNAILSNPVKNKLENEKKSKDNIKEKLNNIITTKLSNYKLHFNEYKNMINSFSPLPKINLKSQELLSLSQSFENIINSYFVSCKKEIDNIDIRLDLSSPNNILKKGYTMIKSKGKVISKSSDLKTNDEIIINFYDGNKNAVIK